MMEREPGFVLYRYLICQTSKFILPIKGAKAGFVNGSYAVIFTALLAGIIYFLQ